RAEVLERVRAGALGREKRALEMRPENAGPETDLGHLAERLDRRRLRRGDERRLVRRDASEEQRLARPRVILPRRRKEVDSAVAVGLEVDEAGNGAFPARPVGETDRLDPAVLNLDVAAHELAADKRSFDTKSHAVSAAFRTEPPAASSRSRAASASTPARS